MGKRQNFKNEEVIGELPEISRDIPEGNEVIIDKIPEEDKKDLGIGKIPAIAFVSDDVKSKLMLLEIGEKPHINLVTKVEDDLKNPAKTVLKKLIEEGDKGNDYVICYLPVSNDDLNRNQSKLLKEINEVNAKTKINIYCYFADREDAEIIKTAKAKGIE